MKKENPIRHLLGVTQLEAAMLLGITRSQWSMFESGKRDLPLPAQQLLADMLSFVQSAYVKKDRQVEASARQTEDAQRKLSELAFKQARLERQIAKIEQEHQWQARRALLEDFLSQRQANKATAGSVSFALAPQNKLSAEVLWGEIERQKHRQELLELDRLLLEAQLRRWSKSTS